MAKYGETKLRNELVEKKLQEGQYPCCLYHYTTWDAFAGIMRNQEIWFGSTASMNDKSDSQQFLKEIESALLSTLPIDKQDKCRSFFIQVFERLGKRYPFAACFSVARDDAAQWERYAANAKGVCITFNTQYLFRAFLYHGLIINWIFYRRDIKQHDLYKDLSTYFISGKNAFVSEDRLIDNLLATSCLHKHESFESEKEVRIETIWNYIPEFAEVFYSASSERMRRVLKLNLTELCKAEEIAFQDLFDSITIGPRSFSEEQDVKEFLGSLGYSALSEKVERSKCPLR